MDKKRKYETPVLVDDHWRRTISTAGVVLPITVNKKP